MKIEFHPEKTRGHADHGWLVAKHSFSFASWQNRHRMHFGALRVLNDDSVAAGMGFGKHPHENMEIITIPLEGALQHEDSMGHSAIIKAGEVQVMSAGSGIYHSEFNASSSDKISLFQLWIFPNKQEVTPRYDQISYNIAEAKDLFLQLVSPDKTDAGSWIYQDAWISIIDLSKETTIDYALHLQNNGVYIMAIEGEHTIEDQLITKRDALGISECDTITIKNLQPGRLLLIEVPMIF